MPPRTSSTIGRAAPAGAVLPKPRPDIEIGISAHLPFVTPYRDAWEVLRTDEVTVRQLTAMRRSDGQARALYRLITLPIRSALKTATFVPQGQVEGGEAEAEFIEQMLTLPACGGGMHTPLNQFIAQLLMALFNGFAAFEMVYQVPRTGPLAGKWALRKLAHRPAETVTFLLDEHSEFTGLRQRTMFCGREIDEVIPGAHVLYYAANEEERPFYGQSYFESAFYHWDKKFKLYVVAHLAAQRAAVGTRVGKVPPNPDREEKLAFQKALADLGIAQWMTVPENYTVESMKESTGFDFLSLINHHNSQMSKSVLAAFFDKEQGGGADSGKLVDFGHQSDALFMLMLDTIMSEIEDVINNKLIPRFIDWNFGTGRYPQFRFGSLSQEQRTALLDLFSRLAVAGQALTITPEFVHELEKQAAEQFGLEIDWETIEEQLAYEREQREAATTAGMDTGADAGPDTAGAGTPVIDPALLPAGFALTQPADPAAIALSELARDLLAGTGVSLTRGVPGDGGPRRVRTPGGAKMYGVPIGTPITLDMRQATAAQGVKGGAYGDRIKANTARTGRQLLGGGPGAKAQNPGGVVTQPADAARARRTFSHPDAPGVTLLDYGDGTVAIRDGAGVTSRRRKAQIEQFLELGWKLAHRPNPGR